MEDFSIPIGVGGARRGLRCHLRNEPWLRRISRIRDEDIFERVFDGNEKMGSRGALAGVEAKGNLPNVKWSIVPERSENSDP